MRSWTAHLADTRPPVVVREGFCWGAFLLGPVWLAWHGAWAALVVVVCVGLLVVARVPAPLDGALLALMAFALGVFGNDLRRGALARRGYTEAHVLAARDPDAALARLLAARPDLAVAASR